MKILCIGEMLIDFTPGTEGKNSYVANPGGAPANVAVSIARNKVSSGFLGKLGNDDFGKLLLSVLRQENVEVLCPELTDEAVTTLAFVSLDEKNDRSFTFARKPGADMLLTKEDVDKVDFSEWDIVHAGSVSQSGTPEKDAVHYALQKAKQYQKLVSFDINYRENIWDIAACKEEVEKLLEFVDFLKISEEELVFVGGRAGIPDFMVENKICVLVLTMGGAGSQIYFDGNMTEIPSVTVPVCDTTGAGDSYWGAFLSSLAGQEIKCQQDITMDKLKKAGIKGAVSSSICVQKMGGIPALPYIEEIDEKMALLEKETDTCKR